MKVSILVPVYNAEKYVEECTRSLFEQTYTDIEYVFVDDGSLDGSMEVLEKVIDDYPQRKAHVKIIHNDTNKGIAYTRNLLLDNASGEYIYFVDSDDYIDVKAIEMLVSVAQKTSADIVRQNYYVKYENDVCKYMHKPFSTKKELLAQTIVGEETEGLWLLFIRRLLFAGYALTFTYGIDVCEDWIMTVKLFYYANNVVDVDEAFYYYRKINNHSITKNRAKALDDRIKALDEIVSFLTNEKVFDEYKLSIYERIIKCKQVFLTNKKYMDVNLYMNYHPEANGYWRHLNYGFRERLLFGLAEHKAICVLKLIKFLRCH